MKNRSFYYVSLAWIAAMPGFGHAQSATASDVAQMVDQLAAQVEAAEAVPFAEGSQGAALARLADLDAALQDREATFGMVATEIAGSVAVISAALPPFPTTLEPTAEPARHHKMCSTIQCWLLSRLADLWSSIKRAMNCLSRRLLPESYSAIRPSTYTKLH